MMDFIIMTLSFAVAMLLASGLAVLLMINKPVIKWYLKKVNKITMEVVEELAFDKEDEEL